MKRERGQHLGQPADSIAVLPLIMANGLIPVINTFKLNTFRRMNTSACRNSLYRDGPEELNDLKTRMLELCIANNIGINAVEERVRWIPGDNNLPPERNFWQLTKFIKHFLYPLHRRIGWSRQYRYGWKDSST